MENDPNFEFVPPEEMFADLLPDRIDLWREIIDESLVEEDVKRELKDRITHLNDIEFDEYRSIEDVFYGLISSVFGIISRSKKEEAARALFENLRDDMWDMFREVHSKT